MNVEATIGRPGPFRSATTRLSCIPEHNRAKAEFENKDNAPWPGLAVTTGLQLGVEKDVLIVPAEVVQHGQNGLYVFIVDDQNRAQVRQVKIAH